MITSEQIHQLRIKQLAERFYANLQECDEGVRNRLTIENEDKSFFNVDNCHAVQRVFVREISIQFACLLR